jgi:hypothetical protein
LHRHCGVKDLTDEDRDRLNGGVERIIQKSDRDEMLRQLSRELTKSRQKLHDAHRIGRLPVIGEDEFRDPVVARADDSAHREALGVRLSPGFMRQVECARGMRICGWVSRARNSMMLTE